VVPRVIVDAGNQAARRFLEFFAATIRNKNTRMAYYRAVCDIFAWCDRHRIGGIADIEPLHVATYIENLQHAMSKPTVSSTWPRSACCSPGWSRARSSPPIRRIPSAARSMW
jgi:hypothetical protein